MLQLILGPSGSGKTTVLRRGGRFLPGAEVLSFSRLALWIFRQLGGLAGEYLDDSGKQLLMSVALSQVEDQLEYYAKKQQNAAFVSSLLEAVEELKNAHILPEQLGELARSAPEEERGLREKSRELSLI